jgi:NhaP-type Na+/H+ or K+/H+ antiporter
MRLSKNATALASLLLLVLVVVASSSSETETAAGETIGSELAGHEEEEEIEPAHAVLLPWFVLAVGVAVYYLISRYFHGVPYTCIMFITGMIMGVGAARSGFDDQLTESITLWRSINAEVLFAVFLPGLLFKDAIEINFHLFQASLAQLLLMAFPMVLAGTFLTACIALYIFPYDWSFQLSLTFGSILAATDPVAVSALLNEVGAPPRLKMHVAGESLLNDGSAVVFFTVFSEIFLSELKIGLGEDFSVGEAFAIFFRMSLGGVSVGVAFAVALIVVLRQLDRRFEREDIVLQVAATVTAAYLSFYTAQVTCKMSGVIAVVVCGIVTKAFGGGLITDWNVMDSFWSLLEHLMNTVIFALGGIEFGFIIADEAERWTSREWGYLIVLYVLLNVIRFFLVFAFFPLISNIGLKSNWKEAVFASFGGLRGAVGIALALGLDNEVREATDDIEQRLLTSRVFGMVGGVAFLTLVINGSLSGPLLKYLGLAETTESRKQILASVEESIRKRLLDDFIHLMTDPRFFHVDFILVKDHVHRLRDLTVEELTRALEQNRESVHPDRYKTPSLDHILPYIPNSAVLKREAEKMKRHVFMTSKVSNLDLAILDEDEELPEPSPSLLKDMRLLFVELLRAAYNAQIRYGELDPREYDGFLVYSLLQSVEFAHDEATSGNPLDDWNLSRILSSDYVDKTRDMFVRVYSCLCLPRKTEGDKVSPLRNSDPLQYQQLRLTLLRAFSFIDAHKEAEGRFRDDFEDSEGDVRVAFLTVMRESQRQVKLAEDLIRSKTKKQLKQVISHYLCVTLQNKSARYIGVLVESGVLLPREAREYLEEIEESVREIRCCPMAEHPGTMEAEHSEEMDDDPSSLRRRRRKRQNSLL